jgi:hypothetical protein
MAHPSLILPKADSTCGKLFYGDRNSAEAHRIALEVWNRATGRLREGYRLAVCRCRRCGGFHISYRPIRSKPVYSETLSDDQAEIRTPQADEQFMSY